MQEKLAKQPGTVGKLLEDVLEINRKGVEAGHASIMLVTLAPLEVPTETVQEQELEMESAELHVPDSPPKGVAPAKRRNAEGSGREIMLQVSSAAASRESSAEIPKQLDSAEQRNKRWPAAPQRTPAEYCYAAVHCE